MAWLDEIEDLLEDLQYFLVEGPEVTIRPATRADLKAILTFSLDSKEEFLRKDVVDALKQSAKHDVFVAELDGKVIGALAGREGRVWGDPDQPFFLDDIVIDGSARIHGAGRKLIKTALDKYGEIVLFPWTSDVRARFARLGFVDWAPDKRPGRGVMFLSPETWKG